MTTGLVLSSQLVFGAVLVIAILILASASWLHNIDANICKGTSTCFSGKITKVVDGDTIDVNGTRIRLSLVNTPERGQVNFAESKNLALRLCPVGSMALVDQDDGQKAGSYGRMIGEVYCKYNPSNLNATSLNEQMLKSGYAEILTNFCTKSEFAHEQWVHGHGC